MKAKQLKMVNRSAAFAEIIPAGISRTAVLGFFASMVLSAQRLNAIAAERAKTIQSKIFPVNAQLKENENSVIAKVNPIAANGSAKMV